MQYWGKLLGLVLGFMSGGVWGCDTRVAGWPYGRQGAQHKAPRLFCRSTNTTINLFPSHFSGHGAFNQG